MQWDKLIITVVILFFHFPGSPVFGWDNFYNWERDLYDVARAVAVDSNGDRVFAAGYTTTTTGVLAGGVAFTVRAYNASTGAHLWTGSYDREGTKSDMANAVAVSPDDTRVFAAGYTTTAAGDTAFTVCAYNASTGSPHWRKFYDREAGSKLADRANAVAVSPDGTKVFAAGYTSTTAGGTAFTVREYDSIYGDP